MKIKPPADVTNFERNELCLHNSKSGRNYAKAKLIGLKSFSNVCSNPQSINPSILSTLHVGGEYPWPIETPMGTTKTTIKQ